ncbi:neuritin-like [Salvelinus namaycush]|uniref:Neuritin-like n=1 Tax=Salvelinus namaycush TaxID=8040 RepID=A0A8U1F7U9_SALNM|nr:neuritin-like [Salvelinus alpinus]XP_038871084.1 neuritin-like [Salvelinus namaycush]
MSDFVGSHRWREAPSAGFDMGMGFTSAKILIFCACITLVSLAVARDSAADVKCENIYRDFSDCVLELGESMDNYQENVTSEMGVEAVCSHWEAFHTCALTALSGCQEEVGSIWETLREDSRKIRFQGSLFDLCSPSSAPSLRSPLPPLPLLFLGLLILGGPIWPST